MAGILGKATDARTAFSRLKIVIGKVLSVENHPGADTIYIEKIDLGEESGPRQVLSGLRNHISIEEFTGKHVLVLANIKKSKLRGIDSHAMIFCAKHDATVELLTIDESVPLGDRLVVPEFDGPADPELRPNHKVWDMVSKSQRFTIGEDGYAQFDGHRLISSTGGIGVKALKVPAGSIIN